MKTLFKTGDVIQFLYQYDCDTTAESIRKKSNESQFVDTQWVHRFLIDEIFDAMKETINQYTYTK